ncbi:MAG: Gfo/Idh/MocA family protein [Bacillota bacterium]|uniref:Gfo/Idh/MocA family oxidoreductase n=1 Tax=Thermanaerosceptrum fracticalcis TaxID=1712410 RepID=A0A7G6E1S0_THEFR|nr:Gfo/Idh/MocA family oxidoreductase [Thermanaerosceptrum fracticalcis]QNB46024.1 hypothetical protein BR63_06655 [Thermanaerosceptrum fracticalcis]
MVQIGVGVIGIGQFGTLHAKTFSELYNVKLIGVSSRNYNNVKAIADKYDAIAYTDYNQLLSNPNIDAVSIAVPPNIQKEMAIKALVAGKHVLLEKPIATNIEDAYAIAETAVKYNRKVMVGYIERFNPSLRRVKSILKNGHIGNVFKVSSRRSSRLLGKPEWCFTEVGMMTHIVGHDVDILKWMLDDKVERVYAESGSFVRNREGQDDNICLLLRFRNGGIGVIEESWSLPSTFPTEENDTRIDIFGTKGVMKVNNLEQTISLCNEEKGWQYPGILRWPGGSEEDAGIESYALKDELNYFIKCIIDDVEPIVTAEDAIDTLRVLLAAKESVKRQKPIYL